MNFATVICDSIYIYIYNASIYLFVSDIRSFSYHRGRIHKSHLIDSDLRWRLCNDVDGREHTQRMLGHTLLKLRLQRIADTRTCTR